MPSIILSHLGWSAPDGRTVLSDLNFRFSREKIGLVGRNGVGKSTLLALIAGTLRPSSGAVRVDATTATLRQTVRPVDGESVADLFGVREALNLIATAERGDASMADLEQCDWTLTARIEEALAEVGLSADPATPLASLSGGQRTRAALGAALFERPDFLLLDEPTNNLDSQGREALAEALRRWPTGAVVVSHDRALLEEMDAIAELTTLGLHRYGGNWSAYRARKDVELEAVGQELATAERRLKEMARKAQAAVERKQRRDAAGARKGAKGDMPRILLGARRDQAERSGGDAARLAERQKAEAAQQARAARARIEVMEGLTVSLPPSGVASGQRIAVLEQVTAGYGGAPLFRDLSLTVTGPERIAVTGPNGSGKSTLLRIIAGQLEPLSGRVQRPASCVLLDQQLSLLDPESSIAANFARLHSGASDNQVRAALARFRFRADAALQAVGTLSGGQLLRAGLACVLGGKRSPPLLMLDEPTNHLDIDSIAAVEQGLAAYDGALMLVSHDPAFLRAVGVDREVAIG